MTTSVTRFKSIVGDCCVDFITTVSLFGQPEQRRVHRCCFLGEIYSDTERTVVESGVTRSSRVSGVHSAQSVGRNEVFACFIFHREHRPHNMSSSPSPSKGQPIRKCSPAANHQTRREICVESFHASYEMLRSVIRYFVDE